MDERHKNQRVKQIAESLGFDACGVSKAQKLEEEEKRLSDWLARGYHGKMKYMENHFDKRLDPTLLVPGAKSVISLLFNYYPEEDLGKNADLKLSKYAYGEDYHHVIKDKMTEFVERLQAEFGPVQGRVFVDSAPVMERQWAARSGLGWIGKHSLLLSKKKGSFFFIAQLIIDLEVAADQSVTDHCGQCTACVDACPTAAIVQEGVVDASRCISYLTIELKEEIPVSFKSQMEGWVFGCDICQDVCPWNRFSSAHSEPRFSPNDKLVEMQQKEWTELTASVFKDLFKKSAVKRAGYIKLKNSIEYCK